MIWTSRPASRLHELALSGDAKALEYFLRDQTARGAVNARDSYGYTALHLAVDRGAWRNARPPKADAPG